MNKHYQEIYDKICRELTVFEANEDPETTDEEWLDVFYDLLVQVQNTIETECEDEEQ